MDDDRQLIADIVDHLFRLEDLLSDDQLPEPVRAWVLAHLPGHRDGIRELVEKARQRKEG